MLYIHNSFSANPTKWPSILKQFVELVFVWPFCELVSKELTINFLPVLILPFSFPWFSDVFSGNDKRTLRKNNSTLKTSSVKFGFLWIGIPKHFYVQNATANTELTPVLKTLTWIYLHYVFVEPFNCSMTEVPIIQKSDYYLPCKYVSLW